MGLDGAHVWRRCNNDDDLDIALTELDEGHALEQSCKLTDGIKCTMRPGSGDFPVGQLEAQNRLPKGRGIPSFASSEDHDCSIIR